MVVASCIASKRGIARFADTHFYFMRHELDFYLLPSFQYDPPTPLSPYYLAISIAPFTRIGSILPVFNEKR